jgi:hypothetical protein
MYEEVDNSELSLEVGEYNCTEILQESLLNSVSNDLLPFMVGQNRDSFTLLSAKDVMLFHPCQQAIQVLCTGIR